MSKNQYAQEQYLIDFPAISNSPSICPPSRLLSSPVQSPSLLLLFALCPTVAVPSLPSQKQRRGVFCISTPFRCCPIASGDFLPPRSTHDPFLSNYSSHFWNAAKILHSDSHQQPYYCNGVEAGGGRGAYYEEKIKQEYLNEPIKGGIVEEELEKKSVKIFDDVSAALAPLPSPGYEDYCCQQQQCEYGHLDQQQQQQQNLRYNQNYYSNHCSQHNLHLSHPIDPTINIRMQQQGSPSIYESSGECSSGQYNPSTSTTTQHTPTIHSHQSHPHIPITMPHCDRSLIRGCHFIFNSIIEFAWLVYMFTFADFCKQILSFPN
ncbi:hypothetical protein WR25_05982 [Diploscapter pachys]|uniref:Uncharacterized protein n=1 Tax=Diploscapter pachys TaxID=2018661 RepID=A0A2A2LQG5_9BILA|nr:hypothetical protein WR25_05982 [Diploscapter pachys]